MARKIACNFSEVMTAINNDHLVWICRYAIYIPLFLPISLPVILSLRQAIRWYRGTDDADNNEHKDKQE